jgi:methyl-accepting chemotaxis protein
MFKNMKLRTKLLGAFLAVGIIPFALIGAISLIGSEKTLSKMAFDQLESVREVKKAHILNFFAERQAGMTVLMETVANFRQAAFEKLRTVQEIKKAQVEEYFQERLNDAAVISKNPVIAEALDSFAFAFGEDGSFDENLYDFLEKSKYGNLLKEFKEKYGYEDLLLVTKDGMVVYTLNRESELSQNLISGELKETGIAKCFQNGLKTFNIQDFESYPPADNQYIAFMGLPILQYGEVAGVLILKLTHEPLNAIVQKRKGMGETGETYLVGKQGESTAYRSDRLVKKGEIGEPKSGPDIEKALSGESGEMIKTGTTGYMEITSYDVLKIPGLQWGIITTISLEEMISPRLKQDKKDYFEKYIEIYGYYNLLLIHPQGNVFYSVTREADYSTNILSGEYANSGLGKLIRQVVESKGFGFADFEPYPPSGGKPFAFIAEPVIHNDEIEMIAAVQISIDKINTVMQERSGMGKTGETYLLGPDKLMRSDSFPDPVRHSVTASFANPEKSRVNTQAGKEALSGKTGKNIITNYIGNRVLSAYTPLDVWGTKYALIAETDEAEAFDSVKKLRWLMNITTVLIIAVIFFVAVLVSRYIVRPVSWVISGLIEIARQLAAAAREVSENSQLQSENAASQAAAVEETSASLEEMTEISRETSELTRDADELMNENIVKSAQSLKSLVELTRQMAQIEADSFQMRDIIKLIDTIAFQTNLLALNAAIEAARAGKAGTGFAVVAEEVRNLAMRTAQAAKNTQELLDCAVERVGHAADAIRVMNKDFESIIESATIMGEKTAAITQASKEVSKGVEQISLSASEIEKMAQRVAAGSQTSAATSEELFSQSVAMEEFVDELATLVKGSKKKRDA